jgi:hypothetical protein
MRPLAGRRVVLVGQLKDERLGELAGVRPAARRQQLVDGLLGDAHALADLRHAQP